MTKPRIRIAHLILQLDIGGLERVMLNTIKRMQETNEEYEHVIVSLTDANDFSQQGLLKPIEIHCMHKKPGNDWGLHLRLFKLFRQLNIDVLHSYNLSTIEYQFVAMLAGVKGRVHAEHGRDIGDPQGLNKKHNFLRKLISNFIHRYIAVSDELYQWLKTTVGIKDNKVTLITNGINTDLFNLPKSSSDQVRFINVARLSPIKDHENLLQACEILSNNSGLNANWQLTIVGDGPLKEQLHQSMQAKGLGEKVTFLGARNDIAQLISQSDVFVLSSIAEGIPMTILEAMSGSTPVISTAVGGIPQVITPDVDGYLVENKNAAQLAQAMRNYIENDDLKTTHGKAAREKVLTKFDEKNMVDAYLDCYQQILKKDKA
ncbi:TIGR03088 family PEP-CTERM/XrtA system glycosyltransferase [Thalassotalea marina]|uniref:Glycosyl transferase family 1 n=1 Tax=Thalassotalea marina TaxID=1673741 RepID=A0A919BLV6_9GAMM|nr:TIGR03088 family PEP-CTERM/XrtA system glycosyltransferase [Thalassotalea marina]GHF99363.1 glycosyl transferase family 1 [Thalassotalea marina]